MWEQGKRRKRLLGIVREELKGGVYFWVKFKCFSLDKILRITNLEMVSGRNNYSVVRCIRQH